MLSTRVDALPVSALCLPLEATTLLHGCLDQLLSPAERALLGALASPKRRQDWLCGRVAAKKAAGQWLGQRQIVLPAASIEIFNEPNGQPFARLARPLPEPLHISISHCAAGGFAAAFGDRIGLDWETVAVRQPEVASYFIHESEDAQGAQAQTALWTIKEAALKLLGLGLSGGLTDVRLIDGKVELFAAARQRWKELGQRPILAQQHFADDVSIAVARFS